MKTTVNSIDVARLAGVSQSTVSRVFTPGASASDSMRQKVIMAAAALGYQPNRLAGSLITHRSHLIGIATGYLGNLFCPVAIEKLVRRLRKAGYHTMLLFTERDGTADEAVEAFLQYRVDGVVLASVTLSVEWVTACDRAGVPVVLFNRTPDDAAVSSASIDNVQGASEVAEFLVRSGHRRIAYIGGREGSTAHREREAGFRQTLAAHGIPLFDRALGHFDTETASIAARELFDRPPEERPDAVFACSDQMALAVMDVLRCEFALSVPQDVSVVGFDDVPQAGWPAYDLTTFRQDVDGLVDALCEAVIQRIESPVTAPRRVLVPGSLVVRSSARMPADWRCS